MRIGNRLLAALFFRHRRRWNAMRDHPAAHQHRAFRRLLAVGEGTAFGREHGLRGGMDYKQLRERVPIRRYEDFEPYLARIRAGERDVLAPGRPRYWARTAGTTGKDKLVPIYPGGIAQTQRTSRTGLALHFMEHPDADVVGKEILLLGSCSALGNEAGLPAGFMSSIMVRELPWFLSRTVLPGTQVDHLLDWSSKIEAIFEMTRGKDICIVAGMPPWISAFFRFVVQKTGKPVLHLWPNLSLVIHSGVAMDSYREEIRRFLGSPATGRRFPSFKNAFAATEGNFAVQECDAETDMTLIADEVFYEFILLDAYLAGPEQAQASRVPLESVRPGEEYVMVLHTPGGFWGYVIGDTVRFSSTAPYRIQISGRTTQFLNVAGEKLSVEQVLAAMNAASHEADAVVEELTLFPRNVEAGQGTFLPGHEWLIEFSRQPKDADLFLGALDAELCRLNPLYRVRRGSSFGETPLLAAPAVCALKRGTYQSWQTRSGRQGGHFKVPRISSSESFKLELLRESAMHARIGA